MDSSAGSGGIAAPRSLDDGGGRRGRTVAGGAARGRRGTGRCCHQRSGGTGPGGGPSSGGFPPPIARRTLLPSRSGPVGQDLLSGAIGSRNLAVPAGAPSRSDRPGRGGELFEGSFAGALLGGGRMAADAGDLFPPGRSEEHTSELQSRENL